MLRLMSRFLFQSIVLLGICGGGALAQSIVPGQTDLVSPHPSGSVAPALPQIEPKPPPQPSVTAPAPPAAQQALPLSSAPIFVLRMIKVEGNTALDEPSIDKITAPYIGKPVSIADLEEIRRQLTLLYVDRGYLNSGFTIPDQNVQNGAIIFRAVEGRVTGIELSGTEHFDPEYFRARLERGLTIPFNVADMERQQQILLQDPLVRRLNIELLPGLVPGEARAHADVLEASPYGRSSRSPTTSRRPSARSAVSCRGRPPTFSASATSSRHNTGAAKASMTAPSPIRCRSPATI